MSFLLTHRSLNVETGFRTSHRRGSWVSRLPQLVLAVTPAPLAACAAPVGVPAGSAPGLSLSTTPPSPDPRVGLRAGRADAAMASWNMRLLSNTPSPAGFAGATNSDLAFLD